MLINNEIIPIEMQVGGIFLKLDTDCHNMYWNHIKNVCIGHDLVNGKSYNEITVESYRVHYDDTPTIELLSDCLYIDESDVNPSHQWFYDYVYFDPEESKSIIESLCKLLSIYNISKKGINVFCSSKLSECFKTKQ